MIRQPKFAEQFYPSGELRLRSAVNEFLNKIDISFDSKKQIKALIVPHAGYVYSGLVAAHAYKLIEDKKYSRVFLIGPSHHNALNGLALSGAEKWQTELGEVEVDSQINTKLLTESRFDISDQAHAQEHSLEVQLPFLQQVLSDFKIISMITGMIDDYKGYAKVLDTYYDENSLFVVSSDLSHYLPYEEAKKIDQQTISQIVNLDSSISHEQACGADGINILIELAKINNWKAELVKYLNSGDTAGDKSGVVGYAAMVMTSLR